ncbi:MAG: class I SAM-dependent RNA methyltransferase [Phycisphaerae bacterium]|nr:class I SAM-dependent RNA methyltransferase [Phycisphaerae bacterium]
MKTKKVSTSGYTYQTTQNYFAQVGEGLEPLAEQELLELGAKHVKLAYRGMYFKADAGALYKITYMSRFIQKIIATLEFFDCHSTNYLYQRASAIEWTDFLTPDTTFAIFSNVSNSHIRHSKYAALCVKDAIADYFTQRFDRRPNVDTDNPDVWFSLFIHSNRAVIGLEVSGGSLHKRGYRAIGHEAPMQETIAAAIIKQAEWDGQRPLFDPMCGSGTLLCEALMHTCRIPSGYLRPKFGFEALPDFDANLWQQVRKSCNEAMRPLPDDLISGSDIAATAIEAAAANLACLPYGDKVSLKQIDFRDISAMDNRTIVCNPPYGLRLQKKEGMALFFKELGDFLKQKCTGSSAYLYFGDRQWIKSIGLKTTWKRPLASGGLDGRLVKLDLY